MLPPKRPYFIRALHEWLSDNNFTPYLMVDATHSDLIAPLEYAQDGRLVLSISYAATKDLFIDNDGISFAARFGGVSRDIFVPMPAVMGLFAKEAQEHALFFDPSEYDGYTPTNSSPSPKDTPKPKPKSSLKIIK